jgi:hypothetical protein
MVGVREIVGVRVTEGDGVWEAVGVSLGICVGEGARVGVGEPVAVWDAVAGGEVGSAEKSMPPQPARRIVDRMRIARIVRNLNHNLKVID